MSWHGRLRRYSCGWGLSLTVGQAFLELMQPSPPPPPETSGLLGFNCSQCGRKLTVPEGLAGASGPCPSCGAIISAPRAEKMEECGSEARNIDPGQALVRGSGSVRRRTRAHIVADSMIDYQHLDRRETAKTLFVIMMFILAICACLAVSWFLNTWLKS